MIVEIMQSHVETGKWYLQHQPTHERADALVTAIRDCDQISDAIRSTARLEGGAIVIGSYRYDHWIQPTILEHGSTTTETAMSPVADSSSTRHATEAEPVKPKNSTVRADGVGGCSHDRTTR